MKHVRTETLISDLGELARGKQKRRKGIAKELQFLTNTSRDKL